MLHLSEEFPSGFLITHAHLDHIMGLVLSCGSLQGSQKYLYGLEPTLDIIQNSALNNKVWPALAHKELEKSGDHDQYVYTR